jgi:hypothetical protein
LEDVHVASDKGIRLRWEGINSESPLQGGIGEIR